ncbi:hypothetical protein ABFS83_12G041800 [Erythranthe nasuta]
MSSSHHNNFSFSSMAITLVLAFSILFVSPSASTSRTLLDHPDAKTGFQVTLKHVDHSGNFTKLELLQRAMTRGRKRIERIHLMALASSSDVTIEAPVHAGNGDFQMDLAIGTPPENYSALLDTGSDLIWTQCQPCKYCYPQSTPIFDPSDSSTFSNVSCTSDVCKALRERSCNANSNCEYEFAYGDGSFTLGVMATETFTFGNVSVPDIAFGCGYDNEGDFDHAAGIVGMGRGELSLVSQLNEPKFSYCLPSFDSSNTSTLLMGSQANYHVNNSSLINKTTPMIRNPKIPTFYYLSLEGITIGDKLLPIDPSTFALREDGSGGMIIDSGTTFTYLEHTAFDIVKNELIEQIKLPVVNRSEFLCFDLKSADHDIEVPKFVFHFDGADLELPGENYINADSSGVACLAMLGSNGMSLFGNVQQQNILVIYDLAKETISFVPRQCDKL